MFFTDNPIGHRWLQVQVTGPMPPYGETFVTDAIRRNLLGFAAPGVPGEYHGLAGQTRFLAGVAATLAEADGTIIDEAFVLAGAVLTGTGTHADWLHHAGRVLDAPELREIARLVERVAHHWTALRITLATARADPAGAAPSVRDRASRLRGDHEEALSRLADIVG